MFFLFVSVLFIHKTIFFIYDILVLSILDATYYGYCPICKKINIGRAWCDKCDPVKLLNKINTSGNFEINDLLCELILRTKSYYDILEWIPYDRFQDIKQIDESGFANIFSATWLDGEPYLGSVSLV
jgi:hypothetical protein